MDARRFAKLMMLTTSDKDGEALVAMRKANAMLARDNLNWEEFLQSKAPLPSWRVTRPRDDLHPHADVGKLFDILFANVSPHDGFRSFVEDVYRSYRRKGYVTDKQYAALHRAAARFDTGATFTWKG